MKRDMDLIRQILMDVQEIPAGEYANGFKYDGVDQATILAHLELLIEAGLVRGRVTRTQEGFGPCAISDLTWEGHDFLSAARNNELWEKAKKAMIDGTVSFTFSMLKKWLESHSPIP